MEETLQLLKKKVEEVSYSEDLFHVSLGENKYIFGYISSDSESEKEPDIFSVKTIYDSVMDLDSKIKYSFNHILNYGFSNDLIRHNPFNQPTEKENEAIYYVENIVFRTSILWDMLAQLCNIHWKTKQNPDTIHYKSFFNNTSQGKKARRFAKEVMEYLNEEDGINDNLEGNHKYVKKYRNQMTNRNSPNISTLSNFDMVLRPPVIYVVERVIEDYLTVSGYIHSIVNEIMDQLKD